MLNKSSGAIPVGTVIVVGTVIAAAGTSALYVVIDGAGAS
ncbi:hypothetical protein AFEL58S_02911 [Afipia felis]